MRPSDPSSGRGLSHSFAYPEEKAKTRREDLEMFLEYVIRRKRASVKVKSAGENPVK